MGPAAIGLGIGGMLLGAYQAKKNRDAAEAQARALSQPQFFEQTTTRSPYGPTIPFLEDLFGAAERGFNTPLPDFPGFHGFGGFGGFPAFEGVDFLSYLPEVTGQLDVPNIVGAGPAARRSLRRIEGLADDTSQFIDPAAEALQAVFDEPSQSFQLAQNYLLGGPLAGIAAGDQLVGPFDDAVSAGVRRDADELLEQRVEDIRAGATGVGRFGRQATGGLEAEEAREIRQDVLDALAAVRAQSFEGAENRALSAGETVAGGLGSLASLRSGELANALSTAPQLEQARFIGPGLAGELAIDIGALDQAAQMFEEQFRQTEHGRSQGNLLSLLGLEEGSRQFGAGLEAEGLGLAAQLRAQEANAFNAYNLDRFNYDVSAPFLRANQFANLLLPFATNFGTTETSGFNQRNYPTAYTPSPFAAGLAGLMGGAQLGLGFQNYFGQNTNLASGFDPTLLTNAPIPGNPLSFFGPFGFR